MNLSPYELVFSQSKTKKPIMVNRSSTTDSLGNCKPTQKSPCNSLPNHTHDDQLGHQPQMKKLQKETFAQNYLNQNKHSRTFINRRSEINTYVLVVKKFTQIGASKKNNHKKLDLTK